MSDTEQTTSKVRLLGAEQTEDGRPAERGGSGSAGFSKASTTGGIVSVTETVRVATVRLPQRSVAVHVRVRT